MSKTALQDAQWLKCLPQDFISDFDRFFWSQPDAAKAWYGDEMAGGFEDQAFFATAEMAG